MRNLIASSLLLSFACATSTSPEPMSAQEFGRWARKRSETGRVELLAKLIAHKTFHEEGNDPPGSSPAFTALERDLEDFAKTRGLRFLTVDHLAHEIGVSSSAEVSNDEKIGVLVHADVVPADEPGWTSDPFTARITDDKIFGRGALDDKGALVAVLYALDALEASGLALRKKPVLIVGSSEETHWEGIERFIKTRGAPAQVFVADGAFPLSVGEKGVATATVVVEAGAASGDGFALLELSGGNVSNAVPASARAVLGGTKAQIRAVLDDESHKSWATTGIEGDRLVVEIQGKAAHGATPDEGVNAIQRMLRFLVVHAPLQNSPCHEMLSVLDELLDGENTAARLGLGPSHPRFSPATVNLGTLELAEGKCTAKLNLRWPPPLSADEVIKRTSAALTTTAAGRVDLTVTGGGLDPFLIDADKSLTSALGRAFVAVTGQTNEEITLSGTTYAKAIPGGAVTFGPSGLSGASDGDRIHVPNEYITQDELGALVEIYAAALFELAR